MPKQKCKCGKYFTPQWWNGDLCDECQQDAAYEQLQSIRAIDAELARRGESVERPGGLVADKKPRRQK